MLGTWHRVQVSCNVRLTFHLHRYCASGSSTLTLMRIRIRILASKERLKTFKKCSYRLLFHTFWLVIRKFIIFCADPNPQHCSSTLKSHLSFIFSQTVTIFLVKSVLCYYFFCHGCRSSKRTHRIRTQEDTECQLRNPLMRHATSTPTFNILTW